MRPLKKSRFEVPAPSSHLALPLLIARHHHHCGHLDCDGLNLHNHIYHGYLDRHRLGHELLTDLRTTSNQEMLAHLKNHPNQVSVACRARHLFNPQPTNFSPLENYHHQFHQLHHTSTGETKLIGLS